MGGIYAMGYGADDLEELFRTQDWSVMLTDRIPARYIPYETKKDQATYLMTIPFSMAGGNAVREVPGRRRHAALSGRRISGSTRTGP